MAEEQKPLPWVEQALRTLATTIHRGTYNHGIPLQPESIATTIECLLPNAHENWQEGDLEADINDPEDGPAIAEGGKRETLQPTLTSSAAAVATTTAKSPVMTPQLEGARSVKPSHLLQAKAKP